MLEIKDYHEIIKNKEYKKIEENIFNNGQTKTTQLFMNLLGFNIHNIENNFINAYIGDVNKSFDVPVCILLFSIDDFETYNTDYFTIVFHKKYVSHKNFIGYYFNGEINNQEKSICFVYEIDKKIIKDFNHFLNGDYSKYSLDSKNTFTKFVKKNNVLVETHVNKIFYKKPDLKEYMEEMTGIEFDDKDEWWQPPFLNDELLNYESNSNDRATLYWEKYMGSRL